MNATGTPPLPAASPTAATAPTATGAPETPARLQRRELARLAILTGVVAIAACMVLAGVAAMAAPVRARGWLGFTFPGLAARPAVAVGILAHNLRSLSGVFVLLIFARARARRPRRAIGAAGGQARRGDPRRRDHRQRRSGRRGARRLPGADGAGAHAARARRAGRLLARHRALPPRPPPQPARRRTWPRSRWRAWRCWRSPQCSRRG